MSRLAGPSPVARLARYPQPSFTDPPGPSRISAQRRLGWPDAVAQGAVYREEGGISKSMFSYETVVRLGHTDTAGVIFFARLFDLIHLAYEAMLEELGYPLSADMPNSEELMPIVHSSADFRSPLRLNDRVRIEVEVEELRARSYTLAYRVLKGETLAAQARTVHVCIDRDRGRARPLPEALARALASRESDSREAD